MLPEMRAELGFRLRNPPTEGGVSEKTRCTADSQVLSGAVTLWTLRNPNLAPRPPPIPTGRWRPWCSWYM